MIDSLHRHELVAAAEALAAGAAVIGANYAVSAVHGWNIPAPAQPYVIAAIVYLVAKIRLAWPNAAAEADAAEAVASAGRSAFGPAPQPLPTPGAGAIPPAPPPADSAAATARPAMPAGAP